MDNKQKKKLYKAIYKIASLFILVSIAFSIYVSGNELYQNISIYSWLDVSLIIIQAILAFILLYDNFKTKKQKNKFGLASFAFVIVLLSLIGFCSVWALNYFNQIVLLETNILVLSLLVINEIALVINFGLGLKISKLFQNTTITIDSVSETPNYDDELLLKKKLDELNRKLEIKKVQEQIEKVEEELDRKK